MYVCQNKFRRTALVTKRTDKKTTFISFYKGSYRRSVRFNREFDREYKPLDGYSPIVAAETWLDSTAKFTDSVKEELEMIVAIYRRQVVAKAETEAELGELKKGTALVTEESLEGKPMKFLVDTFNVTLAKDEQVKTIPGVDGNIELARTKTWDALVAAPLPEPKPAKEPKPKKERDPNAPRAATIPNTAIITILAEKNPKRGASAERFALYQNGMSVAEFIAAGGTKGDVNWDVAHGFISVEIPEATEPA